jgi:glycosyltransferase involved in cell wall biosynthesis
VFILPSIRETGGMVVAEALSNALPVITINAFGAATVVDEDCGFLYNGNTKQEFIDSLSKILLECIENKEMLVKKSKNALKKVEKYTWEEKLLIYSKFYN